eukprot:TRINITY_DN1069_c0_g2_i1.p1 TRINITY_DN1069_c0_g2~~TRINITY_DN1069_c0_g2_i1.p1  ORF type:complete len:1230 (+),score=233.00 TRINITY_DN1069_c0_g2_i1:59-3748(+)
MDEIDESIRVCFNIIDHPPAEYRIVKQCIQALVYLAACRKHLLPIVMLKMLQVIQDPTVYRSNPRRYAVRSIGHLTSYEQELTIPAIELLTKLAKRENENSQYVRKASFCALSRIGRKYPAFQEYMIPLFMDHYKNKKEKASIVWGVLIGLGRMAQSNSLLRKECAKIWFECCHHPNFKLRWAAIKGIGHACCTVGNVTNDKILEQMCYHLGLELLKTGGCEFGKKPYIEGEPDPWKNEEVYLVQYGAMQALGLLLRSNPDEWWPILSPIFGEVLLNKRYAAMVKASVLLTYGKVAYYMAPDNPFIEALKDLLFELITYDNILVSEPAHYSLCNFALVHEDLYPIVKRIFNEKIGNNVADSSDHVKLYFLRSWCKLISRDYHPVLNQCSDVVALHTSDLLSYEDIGVNLPGIAAPARPPTYSVHDIRNVAGLSAPLFSDQNPRFLNSLIDDDYKAGRKEQLPILPVVGQSFTSPSTALLVSAIAPIAHDDNQLLELCTDFSTPVVHSIVTLMTDASLFNNKQFLNNLKILLIDYQTKKNNNTPHQQVDQKGLLNYYRVLVGMESVLKENAVAIMKYPEILDNPLWTLNMKLIVENAQRAGKFNGLPPQLQFLDALPLGLAPGTLPGLAISPNPLQTQSLQMLGQPPISQPQITQPSQINNLARGQRDSRMNFGVQSGLEMGANPMIGHGNDIGLNPSFSNINLGDINPALLLNQLHQLQLAQQQELQQNASIQQLQGFRQQQLDLLPNLLQNLQNIQQQNPNGPFVGLPRDFQRNIQQQPQQNIQQNMQQDMQQNLLQNLLQQNLHQNIQHQNLPQNTNQIRLQQRLQQHNQQNLPQGHNHHQNQYQHRQRQEHFNNNNNNNNEFGGHQSFRQKRKATSPLRRQPSYHNGQQQQQHGQGHDPRFQHQQRSRSPVNKQPRISRFNNINNNRNFFGDRQGQGHFQTFPHGQNQGYGHSRATDTQDNWSPHHPLSSTSQHTVIPGISIPSVDISDSEFMSIPRSNSQSRSNSKSPLYSPSVNLPPASRQWWRATSMLEAVIGSCSGSPNTVSTETPQSTSVSITPPSYSGTSTPLDPSPSPSSSYPSPQQTSTPVSPVQLPESFKPKDEHKDDPKIELESEQELGPESKVEPIINPEPELDSTHNTSSFKPVTMLMPSNTETTSTIRTNASTSETQARDTNSGGFTGVLIDLGPLEEEEDQELFVPPVLEEEEDVDLDIVLAQRSLDDQPRL